MILYILYNNTNNNSDSSSSNLASQSTATFTKTASTTAEREREGDAEELSPYASIVASTALPKANGRLSSTESRSRSR